MRLKNSILNMISELIPQMILMIIGFVKVRWFIEFLGDDVNGFNLTLTQIISYLALVEGGFGISVCQALYKPLAENNLQKVKELYLGSEKILRYIAYIILGLSFVVSFFLPTYTEGVFSNGYTVLVFFIVIIPTVLSYFLMAPTLVVTANQKNYKINSVLKTLSIVRGLLQLGALYIGLGYTIYVIIDGTIIFLQYYLSRKLAFKELPYLLDTKNIVPDMSALENTKHLVVHKLSSIVKSSSNIMLVLVYPGIKGLTLSSIYGSYYYIISMFIQLLGGVINAPKESFGNMLTAENDRVYPVFKEYMSISYFISTIVCTVTWITINDFIYFWIDDINYVQSLFASFCFSYILFEAMVRLPIHNIRDAAGLFKESRLFAILEACMNIGFAFVLVHLFELQGLLVSTLIASLISGFFLNPRLVYRTVFKKGVNKFYLDISREIMYLLLIGGLAFVVWNFLLHGMITNMLMWFIAAAIITTIIAAITFGLYYITISEFKHFILRFTGRFMKR